MKVLFTRQSWEDYLYWNTYDKSKVKRINQLIKEIQRHPYAGSGKPEALRNKLSGFWSRRIDLEHRLIYRIKDQYIEIVKCRSHYGE
ncbi:MAG: Txe/YoeB family addiction module toxin [Bacteroidetes bacterium]|nr:Txe/YoeB family addiction module toxin [Bacteroidota bacterium]